MCRTHELNLRRAPSGVNNQRYTTTGEHRQLVIVAEFDDVPFHGDDYMALWNDIYNKENYTDLGHYGSMHDYFYDQSFGKFNLHFDLVYTKLPHGYAYYGKNVGNYDGKLGELIVDAVKGVEDKIADWSVYDWEGDGYINQVIVQFSGRGENDPNPNPRDENPDLVWPCQWTLADEGTGVYTLSGTVSEQFPNGLKINNFECSAELDGSDGYGTFGLLCHEFSHCFGVPDFYNGSTKFVGSWDVMDYGLYNGNGFCPPCYSAHERWFMGWLDIDELTEPTTISAMRSISWGDQEAYLIRNDGHKNEYYVMENRQQYKWDLGVPGSGLLIFHINYSEGTWYGGAPNSTNNVRYGIVAANNSGIAGQAKWTYPYLNNDSLTNNSEPAATLFNKNTDGTKLMSKPITHMRVNNDGIASFDFMGGASAGIRMQTISEGPSKVLYDMGPIMIIRRSDGTIQKVMKH